MGIIEQLKIRKALVDEIEADLVGPRLGENEIIRINPQSEYVAGVFFPINWEINAEDKTQDIGADTNDEDNADVTTVNANLYRPSSCGLTCRLSPETKKIIAHIKYGQYYATQVPGNTYKRNYTRTPKTEEFSIPIESGKKEEKFKTNENFSINYEIFKDDTKTILTFYVVNNAKKKKKNLLSTDILFQPKIILESVDNQFSFIEDTAGTDQYIETEEDEHLEMLFYKKITFGQGHLCAVDWDEDSIKNRRINKIETTFVPKKSVDRISPTEPEQYGLEELVDMVKIGKCNDKQQLRNILQPLLGKYKTWIEETRNKIEDEKIIPKNMIERAKNAIDKCETATDRIQKGIDVLTSDDDKPFEAFKFANLAIAWQRTMYDWAEENAKKGEVPKVEPLEPQGNWRLFQIAFILMNIESIVDPKSEYRETVDLLWFPTGGGKTEAYLGLVAFTIAYRRLRGKNTDGEITLKSIGTTVLMRYTLRLLTVQQFQRAATLMCACEYLRVGKLSMWGREPFQVGLWVGGSVTPNRRGDRKKGKFTALGQKALLRAGQELTDIKNHNPYLLINCPWCGKQLKPSNGDVCGQPTQWRLFCGRNDCMFSKHLDTKTINGKKVIKMANPDMSIPVVLIDEDVYARSPSLLIATVDKFAGITWDAECKSIFGKAESYCGYCGFFNSSKKNDLKHTHPEHKDKPKDYLIKDKVNLSSPELIIQDELHLISGPLGSMAGLYETAIEHLCTDENGIKPKIIASTATTRAASDQVSKLFNREKLEIFPPQAIEFGNTFFSQVDDPKKTPGKTYLGVLATGKSGLTVLARISAVILRRIQEFAVSGKYDQDDLDPYFTLVSYFNSQRELGGAGMNFKDSVPSFIHRIQNNFENLEQLTPQRINNEEEISIQEDETLEVRETEVQETEEKKQKDEEAEKKFRNRFHTLEVDELTSRKSSGEIPEVLRRLSNDMKTDDPIDLLLATNMLSVGVDIPRLSTMIVAGQPKNHSEYIQATGRIGRRSPGLIVTMYSYTKPRDVSHYENFNIYHSTFYKNVEPVALTPFTVRAREIALFGVLIGMIRMKMKRLSENDDAALFDPKDIDQQKILDEVKLVFENRVKTVDKQEEVATLKHIESLIRKWESYKKTYKTTLKYQEFTFDKISKELRKSFWYLLKSDPASTRQLIPTPRSLRNAEQEQKLFYFQKRVLEE